MSCLFASTDSAKKVLLNPLLSYHIIKYLPLNVLHELPGDNSKLNLCVERVLRNMTTVTCGSQGWPECLHKFDEEDLRGRVSQSLKFYDMSSRVLCHTHNLKVLKLWDIEFYEDMMEALFQHQFMASGTLEHLEIVESDMVKNNRRSNEREETLYRNEKQRLIRKLRSLIVKHCPNLKHLSLTSNSLSDLKTPNSDWNKLVRRLKSLAIHYDPYMKIDMGKNTLPLDLLEVLDFDNCEMEPTCISKLKELTPNLKKLNVGFYGLEDDIFDDCFPKLDHLEELHIYELDDITENERNMASILDKIGKNNGSSLKVLCFTNICLCDIDREMLTPFVKLEEFHHFHRGSKYR